MKTTDFEKQKNASLAHQLIKIGRLISMRGLTAAREAYQLPELKQSHLDLFPYIDFNGSSVSEIAIRKGVSKQSVSKLVQEMVLINLLSLKASPTDGRSKLVFFKTSGPQAIQKGFKALVSIDQQLKDELGESNYLSILKKTSRLIEAL